MELKELQEELAGILYSVDKILKKQLSIDSRINKELNKPIMENLSYIIRYNLLNNINKLHNEGKNDTEIINALKPLKGTFANKVRTFNNKVRSANDLEKANELYNLTQIADFENEYSEILRTYHPLITLTSDQINIATFNMLRQLYMINNIDGFNNLKKEHPIVVHPIQNEEAACNKLNSTIKLYKEQLEKLENDERFNKLENILNDETLLAREEAGLRQQNYKLKEQINTLNNTLMNIYPNGYDHLLK